MQYGASRSAATGGLPFTCLGSRCLGQSARSRPSGLCTAVEPASSMGTQLVDLGKPLPKSEPRLLGKPANTDGPQPCRQRFSWESSASRWRKRMCPSRWRSHCLAGHSGKPSATPRRALSGASPAGGPVGQDHRLPVRGRHPAGSACRLWSWGSACFSRAGESRRPRAAHPNRSRRLLS